MVRGAVRSEPVSAEFSLIAASLQGTCVTIALNFRFNGREPLHRLGRCADTMRAVRRRDGIVSPKVSRIGLNIARMAAFKLRAKRFLF